jgi:hypothetical protein
MTEEAKKGCKREEARSQSISESIDILEKQIPYPLENASSLSA